MACLVFHRDGSRLFEVRIGPGRTTIGRADSCDVALPGEAISRTHLFVEGRDGSWRVVDRSRHGTTLDGVSIHQSAWMPGQRVGIGSYELELQLQSEDAGPTAESVPERSHELVLDTEDGFCVERAHLELIEGPEAGRVVQLDRARLTLGSPGSDIELADVSLVPEHCRLRVARGRVMVEPGEGSVILDGACVRQLTPLLPGDQLTVGQTVLELSARQVVEQPDAQAFGDMVGVSAVMCRLFGLLRRMAGHDAPVLIGGESGTGKELAARGIHQSSSRSARPFIAVNCGAIAANLFESELFGHERGAFTGAATQKDGAFQAAHGGTLFLDEIGELPLESQAKLLRALEGGEVRRVGSPTAQICNVRVVAATNRDLAASVREGAFRQDLFFRLAVLQVRLPPLRTRLEDLPLLCGVLVPELEVLPEAMDRLRDHVWPGNVRELRNVLTRALVLGGPQCAASEISFVDLGQRPPPSLGVLEDAEREAIEEALARNDGNRSKTARELGLARSSLHFKMRKLGIR